MNASPTGLEAVFKAANAQLFALENSFQKRSASQDEAEDVSEISQDCLAGIDDFINDLRREHLDANASAKPLTSLADLLSLHDAQFIDAAFLSVLKRHPDPDGRHHFLEALRSAHLSKVEILGRLRYSPEGKRLGLQLPGLLPRFALKVAARSPVVGGIVRFVLALARLPALLASLQRLESATFRQAQHAEATSSARLQQFSEATRAAIANLSGQANLAFHEAREREERFALSGDLESLRSKIGEQDVHFESLLDAHDARLVELKNDYARVRQEYASVKQEYASLKREYAWVKRFEPLSDAQQAAPSANRDEANSAQGFYSRFEERFRGTREDILERLRELLPYATPALVLPAPRPAVDLGCGRGEWLELLASEHLPALGVDLDDNFVEKCRQAGLHVEKADALTYLRSLPVASVPLVTAFHLVEHLSIRDLFSLLDECRRVLVPGGRVLFETPNPENLTVGANYFWYDHTHLRPLAPDLMQFFLEDRGFVNVHVARLFRNRAVEELSFVDTDFAYNHQLNSLVKLAKQHLVSSPDYAIVAEIVPLSDESRLAGETESLLFDGTYPRQCTTHHTPVSSATELSAYDEALDVREHHDDVRIAIDSLRSAGWSDTPRPARLLDIGGGLGLHAALLVPYAEQTVCTDLRRYTAEYGGEFPKLLKEKFERHGHAFDLSQLELHYADAMALPYRDGWFDVITSFNAFEHIPDPRRALLEMIRVAKPGGYLYITFDPIWTADSGSHFWPMVPDPWAHLVLTEEAFQGRMRDAGASNGQLDEYKYAMNRRRLEFYDSLFNGRDILGACTVHYQDRWEGYSDDSHRAHPNHSRAMEAGYSEAELAIRGMRFVMRKMD